MKRWLSTLGVNQRLALAACVLGVVAIWATPARGSRVTVDLKDLAVIVTKEVDHVRVQDLADWIIKGQADYRLIDLRDEKAYAEYYIPTAESIPLSSLLDRDLGRNEKIVLCSDGGIHSAQAWFLLRASGFKGVYILFGGLDEWKDQILFPALPDPLTPGDAARNARLREISAHFGGTPRTGAAEASTARPPLPQVTVPGARPGAKPAVRKKKEGC